MIRIYFALFLVFVISSCKTNQIVSTENLLEISQFIQQDNLKEIKTEPVNTITLVCNKVDNKISLPGKIVINNLHKYKEQSKSGQKLIPRTISKNQDKPKQINRFAVASFAFGLISVAFALVGSFSGLSLIGLILSTILAFISIIQIYKSKGKQGGLGFSLLGLGMALISAVIIIISSFMFVMGP